jgi:hypothetical protein
MGLELQFRFKERGATRAIATIGRDIEALKAELEFETHPVA